jgi:hypothetical protein
MIDVVDLASRCKESQLGCEGVAVKRLCRLTEEASRKI